MKWRSAGNSTPVDVDPGDRQGEMADAAAVYRGEPLLSRIAVLESREQALTSSSQVFARTSRSSEGTWTARRPIWGASSSGRTDTDLPRVERSATRTGSGRLDVDIHIPRRRARLDACGGRRYHRAGGDRGCDPLGALRRADLPGYLLSPVDPDPEPSASGEPEASGTFEPSGSRESGQASLQSNDETAPEVSVLPALPQLVAGCADQPERPPDEAEGAQRSGPVGAPVHASSDIDDLIQQAVVATDRDWSSVDRPADGYEENVRARRVGTG